MAKKKEVNKISDMVIFGASKHCSHDGTSPIEIAGHKIWLAGSPHISYETLAAAQLLLPLNGSLPSTRHYGQWLPVVECALQDRGGVPESWGAFIDGIAAQLKKDVRILAWCMGAHGRTGTFAASLIARLEPETADPIAAIRERHCHEAVESLAQAKAIFALRGEALPKAYEEEFKTVSFSYSSSSGTSFRAAEYFHHPACICGMCKKTAWHFSPCLCGYQSCVNDRARYRVSLAAFIEDCAKRPGEHQWWCACASCVIAAAGDPAHDDKDAKCACVDCTREWKEDCSWDILAEEICKKCGRFPCTCGKSLNIHHSSCPCGKCSSVYTWPEVCQCKSCKEAPASCVSNSGSQYNNYCSSPACFKKLPEGKSGRCDACLALVAGTGERRCANCASTTCDCACKGKRTVACTCRPALGQALIPRDPNWSLAEDATCYACNDTKCLCTCGWDTIKGIANPSCYCKKGSITMAQLGKFCSICQKPLARVTARDGVTRIVCLNCGSRSETLQMVN